MRRLLVAFTIAMALVVAPAAPSSVAMSASTFDKRLHKQTNKARTARDVRALKAGKCLDRYAQRQARRMAQQRRMFHQDLSVVLRACNARTVAENVAYGFTAPKANIRAWLKSPGHRANMLSGRFTRLGTGVAKDGDGRTYTVQVFGRPA